MTYWYGLGFDDLARMPTPAIMAYLEHLPRRQAEWRLMLAEAAVTPHLKDKDRRALLRRLDRQMARETVVKRTVPPAMLNAIGIGYRTSPPAPLPGR